VAERADDRDKQDVQDLMRILDTSWALHAALDVADLTCARYYGGQQWAIRRSGRDQLPQTIYRDNIATVANLIGPAVRQWQSRLNVNDWGAKFKPTEGHAATGEFNEAYLTARQKQSWWQKFHPFACLSPWWGGGNLDRLIKCSAFGTYYFDPRAPGGVRPKLIDRLTLDPHNRSPELSEHQDVVDARVMSLDEFKSHKKWMAALEDRGVTLDAEAKIADLRTKEAYLGRQMFNLQPGAYLSEAKGVIVYFFYRKQFQRRVVVVQDVKPKSADTAPKASEWYIVEENQTWRYGNPFMKWDCFDSPWSAYSRSVAAEGIPPQDTINLAQRGELYELINVVRKIIAPPRSMIENPDEFKNNKRWGVIHLKPGAAGFPPPAAMDMSRPDRNAETLIARAVQWMREGMSVQEPMMGISQSNRPVAAETQQLIVQGSVPIQAVADRDFERANQFFDRMATAALLHYGRVGRKTFVSIVGHHRARLSGIRVAVKALEKHPTICLLHRGAFLARNAQEVIGELDLQLRAGHITKWQRDWEVFLQTGYEGAAGQEVRLHNVELMLYEMVHGKRDPMSIRQEDDLLLILYVVDRHIRQRVIDDLTDKQTDILEEAALWCWMRLLERGTMQNAIASLGAGFAPPSEMAQMQGMAGGAPGAAPESPAVAGAPNGGELVAAAR